RSPVEPRSRVRLIRSVVRCEVILARSGLEAAILRAHLDAVAFPVARGFEAKQILAVQLVGYARECRAQVVAGTYLEISAARFDGHRAEAGMRHGVLEHGGHAAASGADSDSNRRAPRVHADRIDHHFLAVRVFDDLELRDELPAEPW